MKEVAFSFGNASSRSFFIINILVFLFCLWGCPAPNPSSEEMTDDQAVAADKVSLQITFASGDSASSVTGDLTLPTTGAHGTTISWSSNALAVISTAGAVVRPASSASNATVVLTATISKGSASNSTQFILTVLKTPLSDTECVAADKASLQIVYTTPDTQSSVTQNLILPKAGPSGTTISWSSDPPSIVNATTGEVVRPNSTTPVTLTATITKGSASDTLAFTVTVIISPTAPVSHFFSGTVQDSRTGAAVPGLTVDFATYTATTGSDGSFTIDLGNKGGTVSGAFCMHGTGYSVLYATPLSLDTSKDSQVSLYVTATSAYPTHSITIRLFDSDSVAIAAGTHVDVTILNRAGGNSSRFDNIYTTDGITIDSPTFGSDCLVAAGVGSPIPFNLIARQVDLSSSSKTVSLFQDTSSANTTTVNITADAGVDYAQLILSGPYGSFKVSQGIWFSGSPPSATRNITNPFGYTATWIQWGSISDYLGSSGCYKIFASYSNPTTITPSVTLLQLNSTLGPNAIPDPASIAYNGGTLSIAPVSGASFYQLSLFDITTGLDVGTIFSTGASVSLPSWLTSQLATHSVSMSFTPADIDLSFDLLFIELASGINKLPPVPFHEGAIGGNFTKTITF